MNSSNLDFTPYVLILVRRRKFLTINLFLVTVLAFLYAFLVAKKEYMAQVLFLPPTTETPNIASLMGGAFPPITSSLSSEKSEVIETIFRSRALKRNIIDKFGLYEYHNLEDNANRFEQTIEQMRKQVVLDSDQKGGLGFSSILSFNMSCYHRSPDTAKQMVNYVFSLVDSAFTDISVDRARRSRIFIQDQIDINTQKLNQLQAEFHEFQVSNKAYDLPMQIEQAIKSYSELKASSIMNELQLRTLLNEYKVETPEIKGLRSRGQVFQRKLREMEVSEKPDVLPSFNFSSKIISQYTDMYRDLETQNQLLLLLRKELEQAKLQEARTYSPLVIIDPPFVPEYKARPKRLLIIAVIVSLYMFFIFGLLLISEFYRSHLKHSQTAKIIMTTLKQKEPA